MISISALRWVPDFAQGYVKDLRVRWALEEAGLPYTVRSQTQADRDTAEYRSWQPFGQVPAFEEDGLRLFESGAIVLHIGERSEVLLPKDIQARARAVQWLVAALNSIEPSAALLAAIDGPYRDETWAQLRRPSLSETVRHRLDALCQALGDRPFLDGDRFTVGDLVMTTVLRDLDNNEVLTSNERLAVYVARCMARPAFKRAHAAQIEDFKAAA
jgi:glutathione S-transferase